MTQPVGSKWEIKNESTAVTNQGLQYWTGTAVGRYGAAESNLDKITSIMR